MTAQDFDAPWPAVLQEMHEFALLTHLALGRGRPGEVRLSLSRQRVAADALQPHVAQFRAQLQRDAPQLRLSVRAVDAPAHRIALHY